MAVPKRPAHLQVQRVKASHRYIIPIYAATNKRLVELTLLSVSQKNQKHQNGKALTLLSNPSLFLVGCQLIVRVHRTVQHHPTQVPVSRTIHVHVRTIDPARTTFLRQKIFRDQRLAWRAHTVPVH